MIVLCYLASVGIYAAELPLDTEKRKYYVRLYAKINLPSNNELFSGTQRAGNHAHTQVSKSTSTLLQAGVRHREPMLLSAVYVDAKGVGRQSGAKSLPMLGLNH